MSTPSFINGRSNLATDPVRNFRFLVTFMAHDAKAVDFKTTVGFTSLSGLSVQTESIPYREGGYNTSVHQIPGQTSFSPITCQRGVVLGSKQNWEWMRRLYRVVNNTGRADGVGVHDFRADLEVAVLSHPMAGSAATRNNAGDASANSGSRDDHVALRFRVYNAWPTALAFSDLNAGDNALMVEQMTLVHEGWDLIWADKYDKSAASFNNN